MYPSVAAPLPLFITLSHLHPPRHLFYCLTVWTCTASGASFCSLQLFARKRDLTIVHPILILSATISRRPADVHPFSISLKLCSTEHNLGKISFATQKPAVPWVGHKTNLTNKSHARSENKTTKICQLLLLPRLKIIPLHRSLFPFLSLLEPGPFWYEIKTTPQS